MEADIRVIEVVDSTNIRVAALADEGAPEGTCVVAFCQQKGQGRSGRTFFSPEGGNLYMSLLLRPKSEEQTDHITVAAAVAALHLCADKQFLHTECVAAARRRSATTELTDSMLSWGLV